MNFNEYYITKAEAQLETHRMENAAEEIRRHNEVVKKVPEYSELEKLLAGTADALIDIIMRNSENRTQELEDLKKKNLDIQRNMSLLLVNAGFDENYLDRIYTCPQCKDRGIIDRKWCQCVRQIVLGLAAEELNAVSPLELSGFDTFSLDYYSDSSENGGVCPRNIMKRNLEYCKSYAEEFTMQSEGIMMSGGTGLGKTHLSLAIASVVIAKGYNVIYGSCPELLRTMEREYFGKSDDNTMETLTQCDLLILDDLGAEMDKPLYSSLLYELINSRVSRKLPTIVNTNLVGNEFHSRYDSRICSRLLSFETLIFIGQDVRIKIKNEKH